MLFCNKKKWSLFFVLILAISILSGCGEQKTLNNSSQSVFINIDEESIDTEDAIDAIEELSAPKYNGRLTGTEGNILAIEYIESKFKELGLEVPQGLNEYRQVYNQKTIVTEDEAKLKIIDLSGNIEKEFDYIKDFSVSTLWENTCIKGNVKSQGYFVDETTELVSENKELENKILLIGEEVLNKYQEYGVVQRVLFINSKADAVIMNIDDRREGNYKVSRVVMHNGEYKEEGPIVLYCSNPIYEDLLRATKEGKEIEISVDFSFKDVETANVVGVIQGSDEKLKNEYIIIGAHLDHVGDNKDGTYNPGAFDNASGIGGLVEIAESIMEGKKPPKKTIIFIAFNGEEEALFGSNYYAQKPIYPLDNSVMINLDMIGAKADIPLEINIASSGSMDLMNILKDYSKELNIEVKNGVLDRSDHAPFDQKGVESVLLIYMDESRIHTITDTMENTINEEKLREAIDLVLYYIDKNAY